MTEWFAKSEVNYFRRQVENRLIEAKKLSPSKDKEETAAAFWVRMEKAGLLEEVLKLYDQIAESHAERAQTPRETKKKFAERIEREGRRNEVEEERQCLSESGYSLRQIHEMLVEVFQPLDGSKTRPWTTPDPWENGRLFRKKEDQNRLAAEIEGFDERDYCPESRWRYEWKQMHQEKRLASSNAQYRIDCAGWRREERVALANARRRGLELKAAAEARRAQELKTAEEAKSSKAKESEPTAKPITPTEEPKINGKWEVVKGPSGFENKWVPEGSSAESAPKPKGTKVVKS
jgi:hypothetical protein